MIELDPMLPLHVTLHCIKWLLMSVLYCLYINFIFMYVSGVQDTDQFSRGARNLSRLDNNIVMYISITLFCFSLDAVDVLAIVWKKTDHEKDGVQTIKPFILSLTPVNSNLYNVEI